jgi:thiol:disulfide interchange protein DsbC
MKTTIKTSIILFLVSMLFGSAQAQAAQPGLFGTIKAVKNLPIDGVKIIESDKGTFFVSENGRFAWKGPIYDMWNGKQVQTIEDADTVVNHVDIKKIGLDPNQMATLTMGQGDQEEVIFVSSDCPHCRKLLEQAGELKDKYKFRIVLLPMGPKSMEHTKQLLCAQDKEAAIKALVSGNYEALGEDKCDLAPLQRTLVAARILGLRGVPYLIRHDGQVQAGELRDLAGWLVGDNDKADRALGAKPEGQKSSK